MRRRCRAGSAMLATAMLLMLGGCASTRLTVDDGQPVDEGLMQRLRSYGAGERALRPAIVRSSRLNDKDCDRQWELPFAVASSAAWEGRDRIAWVRALQVDERLTVIAADAQSPLPVGQRLKAVGRRAFDAPSDAEPMIQELASLRDTGRPFSVTTAEGRSVVVKPFEVCRGYARLAPPSTPQMQDYHWLMSLHPLEVAEAELEPDEALWVVLWGQGLSEEGGARMKAWHYTTTVAGALFNVFTIASGLKGAALAAQTAVDAARNQAAKLATELLRQQLVEEAKKLAVARLREELSEQTQKLAQQQAMAAMQQLAVNRGLLGGVARIGATVWDRADLWAWERMQRLGANAVAGFTLHQKLIERGAVANAIAFDAERLAALDKVATGQGRQAEVAEALRGVKPQQLLAEIGAMPLASSSSAFAYDDAGAATAGPWAQGLIDASLGMPTASAAAR